MKDAPPRNFARLHSHWLLMADTIYGANLNSMYSYVEANNQRNFSQHFRPGTLVTLQFSIGGSNHGLACGECDGPTPVFYCDLSAGRRADEQSMFAVQNQPQDGLQMVEPVSRFRRRGIG